MTLKRALYALCVAIFIINAFQLRAALKAEEQRMEQAARV
jgi:hypothetical protein